MCVCEIEGRCFSPLTDDTDGKGFFFDLAWMGVLCFMGRYQAGSIELIFVESACFCLRIKIVPGDK